MEEKDLQKEVNDRTEATEEAVAGVRTESGKAPKKAGVLLKILAALVPMVMVAAVFFCMYYLHRTDEGSREGLNEDTGIWQRLTETDAEGSGIICSWPEDENWIREYACEDSYLMIETDGTDLDTIFELTADVEGDVFYIPADAAAAEKLDEAEALRCATKAETRALYLDALSGAREKNYPFACVICPFGSVAEDGMINYGTDGFTRYAREHDIYVVFETEGEENIRYVMSLYCDGIIVPAEEQSLVLQLIEEEY